ncbi:MAG: leucine-rich repeat protein [Clostridiales bacterium]|nr:leucine-rich repeat protein [Clostridiales bacterium]
MKLRKPILVTIILALVAAMIPFAVACGDDDAAKTYTMSFETYGGTEIEPITAVGGSMIFAPSDPEKAGSTFMGWYTDSGFSGDAVVIPNIMPNNNVTYYAKFDVPKTEYTVIYEYNKGQVPHAKDIPNVTVQAGETVTVADGNDYGAVGYMFMGWSIYPNGLVTDVKQDGQYDAGDKITLTDKNVKLYAQWAVEYTDARKQNDDKIYVYEPLIGKGKGAAKLIRADENKQDLDGFVSDGSETTSGSTEFTFYADEFENGEFMGRLYADRTYATSDGKQGNYVMYDHVWRTNFYDYTLALDGFGYAVMTQLVGDQVSVFASGDYEYDSEHDDYVFKYNEPKDDDDAKPKTSYFNVVRQKVEYNGEETDLDGVFTRIGGESGTFANVTYFSDNEQLRMLQLSGYGNAMLSIFDTNGTVIKEVDGVYYGTDDNYTDATGEWQFEPVAAINNGFDFKFTLDTVPVNNGTNIVYYSVYYECDETVAGTYAAEDSADKSTLYLDGYGMAEYNSNGVLYVGVVDVTEDNSDGVKYVVEFTECKLGENGQWNKTNNVMVFVLFGNKFAVSKDGLIIADGVLSNYTGKSTVVEIPDTVTEIAADAFNYVNTKVSLVSVTVPASVTKIGARAFQNNYTLRRAIFLGTTPAQLDYTGADNNPFRWGDNGGFIIIVPDTAVEAYKTDPTWSAFADKIMGVTEATTLPEWVTQEVEISGTTYNVLVQYNPQVEIEEDTRLDIVIPEDIDIINNYVFRGMDFIKSVDLSNVILVGESAFYGCVNLETAKMPNVQILGKMAFAACEKLNNSDSDEANVLKLPAIKTIDESAFSGCEKLRLVQLGENINEIGDFAFYQCNVYEADPALVVELMGENAPTMGSKVTLGNIAFRFKVQSIDVALNCYKAATWSAYVRHLYKESGEEAGMYVSGDDTLELNGRAIYQGSYVWMYSIDGDKITFYEYDSSSDSKTHYTAIEGTYFKDGGIIKMAIGSSIRNFTRLQDSMTYRSKDGNYTLVCDPMDLQPDNYENNSGYADVKFNGKDVKLYINGYNTKIIYKFEEDGKLYDIYISFDGEWLNITRKLSPVKYEDITAPDDSKITILIQNGNIYILTAEFEIVVDEATGRKLYWTEASGLGVFARQNGNVFTFSFRYLNVTYTITATVSADYKTFTYDYVKA